MKKTLSVILSIIMIIAFVPVAFAEGEDCTHVWTWNYFSEGKDEFDCTVDTVKRSGVCGKCGAEVTEDVPVQSSHFWDQVGTTEPACGEYTKELYDCRICTQTKQEILNYQDHLWGDWEVFIKCFQSEDRTANGKYIRYCSLCEQNELKDINNHSYLVMGGTEPDCYKPGRTQYKNCLVCDSMSPSEEIPMLSHVDADENGKCDLCDGHLSEDGSSACRCLCHNEMSIVQKFILPILQFIWRLLKMNTCDCGVVHA